jgi:hypothetical protein
MGAESTAPPGTGRVPMSMGARAMAMRREGATAMIELASLSMAPAFFIAEEKTIIRLIRQTNKIVSALRTSASITVAIFARLSPRHRAIARPPIMAAIPRWTFREVRKTTRTKTIRI